jgi:magnesium transporter
MRDFILEILNLIQNTMDDEVLSDELSQYHASDIADSFDELTDEEIRRLYDILPSEFLADIITYIEEKERYLDLMENEDVADILDNMESNDAAEVLEELDEEDILEINQLVEPETLEDINLINSYDDNELGSVMSTDYIEIKADLTIKQAMKAVINSAYEVENINVIYVTDEVGKYVGIITLRDLIRARSTDLLEDIIKTNYPTLYDYSLLDEIDHDILDYELESYGVLDRRGLLIGIVNDETLIELVEEEYKEDYAMLAGISEIEDTTEPIYKSVLARLPWLAFLLVIGLLVSLLTSSFEKVILELTTVVFFQSLILGMAGNTGTQSLAVTISKLNDDEKKIGKVIKRELITGFLNGLIIAVIAFGLVMGFLLLRNEGMAASLKTALSVSISLIISMSIAAFLGAFVPYVLSKLKVDPAVASGPFITTINDIVAIIIYYSLASLLFTIL